MSNRYKHDQVDLPYFVHNEDGALVARTLHGEDAAALVAILGDGATIRVHGSVLWHEGHEDQPAGESYDHVARLLEERAA